MVAPAAQVVEALREEAARASQLDRGSALVAGSRVSAKAAACLRSSEPLRLLAAELVGLSSDLQVDGIAGASEAGERLAVAAVMHASNGLRLFQPGDAKVLLVEGTAVTGIGIARGAKQLKEHGAGEVYAAIAFDARISPSAAIEAVAGVEVLGC